MWNSLKKSLLSRDEQSTTNKTKEHRPFNLDLSTRCGFEAKQNLETQTDTKRLQSYKQAIAKLPMPPVLWDQYQRTSNAGASNHKITAIITSDPVLSAMILKTVNSPAFGLTKTIVNLNRAISHLGSNMVRGMVAKHCFSSVLPQKNNAYNIEALWKHGMAVSALAEVVSKHIPKCDAELAATIGLFHDIGRMGFNFFKTDHIPAMFDHDEGYLHFEAERFGCTHIEMGDMFAQHWHLPEKVRQGMAWHHHPGAVPIDAIPEAILPEIFAVYVADLLAKHLEFHGGNASKTLPHESYRTLIPKTNLYDIMHEKAVSKELWRINCIDF